MNETNPYLKRLDLIKQAREKFEESEWRLNFLRSLEPTPLPKPSDEELLKWNQTLPQLD